jgi:erythromycin esterase-like protein
LEYLLHQDSAENKLILLKDELWKERLKDAIPHRAIGVVYHPEYERGNYVPSLIPSRYDAMIYIDRSRALHPLHIKADISEVPETYPFGF